MSLLSEATLLFVAVLGHGIMLGVYLAGPLERRLSRSRDALLDAKQGYIVALEVNVQAKDEYIARLLTQANELKQQSRHIPMHTAN